MNNSFVATIVIGSSNITALAGRKEPEGTIKVLAHTSVSARDFVSKGRVINVDKFVTAIKNVTEQLEESTNCNISRVYVAINCMGIRTIENRIEQRFAQRESISEDHIARILNDNEDQRKPGTTILEAIQQEFRIGSVSTIEPIGMITDSIKAQLLNIICKDETISNIESSFRKADLQVARIDLSATQLASVVTTDQERTSGCVFVHMGSETTSVAIYKAKFLRHLAVIPLGGANITRDIAKIFNCEEDEAEELKRNYGYPDFESMPEDGGETIQLRDGGRTRKQVELAEIIDARVEEIVQNIKHQINLSGFNRDSLVNGIYITGGASQLSNISAAFDKHFEDWNIRFSKSLSRLNLSNAARGFNDDGRFNVALSIVENGKIDCNGGERRPEPEPMLFDPAELTPTPQQLPQEEKPEPTKPQKPSLWSRAWKGITKMLNDGNENI